MASVPAMVLHWLHVLFAVSWLGTVFYTRVVLFPALGTLSPGVADAVRPSLVAGRARQITLWMASLTIGTGVVRGVVGGALTENGAAYAITFQVSALLGAGMLLYLFRPWGGEGTRKLYLASFPVIFTLMILMRFGL